MCHFLMSVLCVLLLVGCSVPLQGPPADLAALATPDPIPPAVARTIPQPPPGPVLATGQFRAWVPRQTQSNGDTVDGHWQTISLTPPLVEGLEPAMPMPRAPKTHVVAKP